MTKPLKHSIMLVEPSEIVREGFARMIEGSKAFCLVGSVPDLAYLGSLSSRPVDVLIINPLVIDYSERADIRLALGIDPLTSLLSIAYNVTDERTVSQYDGSIGILDSREVVLKKIQQAVEASKKYPKAENGELSARERSILAEVAKGKTNKEIADEFNLSVYTVVTHRKNISHKLGINSVAGLTVYAIMNKLVDMSNMGRAKEPDAQ